MSQNFCFEIMILKIDHENFLHKFCITKVNIIKCPVFHGDLDSRLKIS